MANILRKLGSALFIALFTIVVLACSFAWAAPMLGVSVAVQGVGGKVATQVSLPTSTFAPPKPAVSPITVSNRIKQTGKLITVENDTIGTVVVSQDNPGVEFAGITWWKPENTTVTMLVYGTASIGVDLEKSSWFIDDNTLTITLPPAQVFGWEMDTETSDGDEETMFVEFNVPYRVSIVEIGAVRPETATYANQQAKTSGLEQACIKDENGKYKWLELANVVASDMFKSLVSDLGFDVVTVNVQAPTSCP